MLKICCVVFVCFALSCKKEAHQLKPLDYTLTYEVITSSGEWYGEYNDSTGKRVSTGLSVPGGWKYTYRLQSLPFEMFVNATTTCTCRDTPSAPDVTINFYSNGVLFKTETNKWAKGVTSLDFQLQ